MDYKKCSGNMNFNMAWKTISGGYFIVGI